MKFLSTLTAYHIKSGDIHRFTYVKDFDLGKFSEDQIAIREISNKAKDEVSISIHKSMMNAETSVVFGDYSIRISEYAYFHISIAPANV